jgi:tetratricopeptide (TPR) repeat protein
MVRTLLRDLGMIVVVNLVGLSPLWAAKWVKLEADEFTIYGDVGQRKVVDFARKYAASRHALQEILGQSGVKVPRSVMVLNASHTDFLSYTTETEVDDRDRRFSSSMVIDGRSVTALSMKGRSDRVFEIAMEFDTVWALERFGWSLPTWMSQGTGIVFSTSRFNAKTGEVVVGERPAIGEGIGINSYYDWDEFLRAGRNSDVYRERRNRRSYHAQAWSLMHWILLQDEKGPERFAELESRLADGDWEDALVEVGEVPLQDLRKTILKHVRGRIPTVAIPFDADAAEANFVITALDEVELLALKSIIAGATGRHGEADRLYFAADSMGSDLPVVLEAEAQWYLRQGDRASAVMSYREATEKGSTNAHAYLVSADWRLDQAGGGYDTQGGGIPMVMEPAEAEIMKALELDPGLGWGYALLGRIAYLEPEPDPAWLDILSSRVGPDQWGTRVRYYRGLLLERLDRMDEAVAEMVVLKEHPEATPQTRRSAKKRWLDWQTKDLEREVRDLINAQRFAEAHEVIRVWSETNEEPELEPRLEHFAEVVSHNQVLADQHRFDRERQRLQNMLKMGQFEEAWVRVKELKAEATSDSLRKGFGRLETQIGGVVLSVRVKQAAAAEDWETVVTNAEAFLSSQPEDHRSRAKIERALGDARTALDE